MLGEAHDVGYRLIVSRGPALRPQGLRMAWDVLRARGADALVLVDQDAESGKPIMIAAGTDAAVAGGFHAGNVVKSMAEVVGGRGGGKADMAQGGGENAAAIDAALQVARDTLGVR